MTRTPIEILCQYKTGKRICYVTEEEKQACQEYLERLAIQYESMQAVFDRLEVQE